MFGIGALLERPPTIRIVDVGAMSLGDDLVDRYLQLRFDAAAPG